MSAETEWVLCIGGKHGLEFHGVEPPCLLRRWWTNIVTAGAVQFYRATVLDIKVVYRCEHE